MSGGVDHPLLPHWLRTQDIFIGITLQLYDSGSSNGKRVVVVQGDIQDARKVAADLGILLCFKL